MRARGRLVDPHGSGSFNTAVRRTILISGRICWAFGGDVRLIPWPFLFPAHNSPAVFVASTAAAVSRSAPKCYPLGRIVRSQLRFSEGVKYSLSGIWRRFAG